jgi:NitT/TauT family transport system permease protein
MQNDFVKAFLPNRSIGKSTLWILIGCQVAIALLLWWMSPLKVIPKPVEVFSALGELWTKNGLGNEIITSFSVSLKALVIAVAIALVLAYLTVIPFFHPIMQAISKGRFLSLVGLSFLFILAFGGGSAVKLACLVFGITVYMITSFASIVINIPKAEFDHARTLRMTEWRVVWEVVVLGTLDKMLDAIRQNAAIMWTLLTMVETNIRVEGGVGVMLADQNKIFNLPKVFAIQLTILLIGLLQDGGLALLRKIVCPYADLTLERDNDA